jgi:hypothetical protein
MFEGLELPWEGWSGNQSRDAVENFSETCSASEPGINVMPPFQLIAFADLPAE